MAAEIHHREGLDGHRDHAFAQYGRIACVRAGGQSTAGVVISANPNTVDETGAPIGQVGEIALGDDLDAVLTMGLGLLRDWGCHIVRGPISRHTWYPFRCVTAGFDACPPLTGEPWNAPELAPTLRAAGFEDVAWYVSTWTHDSSEQIDHGQRAESRLLAGGYTVRPLDTAQLPLELARVHAATLASFRAPMNYMFTPISLPEFQLVVGPGGGGISPDLFLMCEDSRGELAGFCYTTAENGGTGSTPMASIKTLVVHPKHRGAGVGSALVGRIHERCRARGLTTVAHTLMREDGPSVAISSHGTGDVFRRYAVLEAPL